MAHRVARLVVYQDNNGGWRWRLIAANGKIVADSAEAYSSLTKARDAAKKLPVHAHLAKIELPA